MGDMGSVLYNAALGMDTDPKCEMFEEGVLHVHRFLFLSFFFLYIPPRRAAFPSPLHIFLVFSLSLYISRSSAIPPTCSHSLSLFLPLVFVNFFFFLRDAISTSYMTQSSSDQQSSSLSYDTEEHRKRCGHQVLCYFLYSS